MSHSKSITRRKKKSSEKKTSKITANKAKKNMKLVRDNPSDVDMEKENEHPNEQNKINYDFIKNDSIDDMDVDERSVERISEDLSKLEWKLEIERPLTDQEKLDYFHKEVMEENKQQLIDEDLKTIEDPLTWSEYVDDIFTHLK